MSHKKELTYRIEADGIVLCLMACLGGWLINTIMKFNFNNFWYLGKGMWRWWWNGSARCYMCVNNWYYMCVVIWDIIHFYQEGKLRYQYGNYTVLFSFPYGTPRSNFMLSLFKLTWHYLSDLVKQCSYWFFLSNKSTIYEFLIFFFVARITCYFNLYANRSRTSFQINKSKLTNLHSLQ